MDKQHAAGPVRDEVFARGNGRDGAGRPGMRAETGWPLRFLWRLARNAACATPIGRSILFPRLQLAERFGPGDAEYAWSVFAHHHSLLHGAGFTGAKDVLEIGPGRNLGTSLLWWAHLSELAGGEVRITCWDVFQNASPDSAEFWPRLAFQLLEPSGAPGISDEAFERIRLRLEEVKAGRVAPGIDYRVCELAALEALVLRENRMFDMVYSHAALEHVWDIGRLWDTVGRMSARGAWHSYRIDLADHGRRETNPLEMLEWSAPAYWLTMRFVPGAINRWRACHHLEAMARAGLKVVEDRRVLLDALPVPMHRLARGFRALGEQELRAIALDAVARG